MSRSKLHANIFIFKFIFAAGSFLAHNDWKRMKCGAGVAIAGALGAVKSLMRLCQ
ncbi:MAG: hypothetical protein KJP23_06805 [Deltaproteobacteria bacterium]|nr:hypothetical protein [Deltaproteobacteria bacterium]